MPAQLSVPLPFGPDRAPSWFEAFGSAAGVDQLRLEPTPGAELRPTGEALLSAASAERELAGLSTVLGGDLEHRLASRTPIVDARTARELAEASAERLEREHAELAPSVVRMARFVFEELGVNVVQHSGRSSTGFGSLRVHDGRLEIAFADRGVGFLASLQRNPELEGRIADEGEALQLALGKGLTGTSGARRNMGLGLGLLQDFADRLEGDLHLASDGALLRRRTLAGVRTTTVQPCPAWRGSWICLDAPLERFAAP